MSFTHHSNPKVAAGLSLGSTCWSCCSVICTETGAALTRGSTGADGINVLNMGRCTCGKNRAYTVVSSSATPMKVEKDEFKLKGSAASCRCSGEFCPWLSTSPSRHPCLPGHLWKGKQQQKWRCLKEIIPLPQDLSIGKMKEKQQHYMKSATHQTTTQRGRNSPSHSHAYRRSSSQCFFLMSYTSKCKKRGMGTTPRLS